MFSRRTQNHENHEHIEHIMGYIMFRHRKLVVVLMRYIDAVFTRDTFTVSIVLRHIFYCEMTFTSRERVSCKRGIRKPNFVEENETCHR